MTTFPSDRRIRCLAAPARSCAKAGGADRAARRAWDVLASERNESAESEGGVGGSSWGVFGGGFRAKLVSPFFFGGFLLFFSFFDFEGFFLFLSVLLVGLGFWAIGGPQGLETGCER